MTLIYHIVLPVLWTQRPEEDYRAASLATEGFIHCSHGAQLARSANRYYADAAELLVLHIDPARLTAPLVEEPAASGELFPHIYGPLNRTAVVHVALLRRGADGLWVFETGIE